ncbi:hypothetical protein JA1_003695 [Spathaspora sp. JA1]|nr:hypothetical protein JA1_003695 [Spathaspora sp. JA1]
MSMLINHKLPLSLHPTIPNKHPPSPIHTENFECYSEDYRFYGHEIFKSLCIVDHLFQSDDILDVKTIEQYHSPLKRYFSRYRPDYRNELDEEDHIYPEIDHHLRKYLEFLRIIKPQYNYWLNDGQFSTPVGEAINKLIPDMECYLDLILNQREYFNFNVNIYMV